MDSSRPPKSWYKRLALTVLRELGEDVSSILPAKLTASMTSGSRTLTALWRALDGKRDLAPVIDINIDQPHNQGGGVGDQEYDEDKAREAALVAECKKTPGGLFGSGMGGEYDNCRYPSGLQAAYDKYKVLEAAYLAKCGQKREPERAEQNRHPDAPALTLDND